MFDRISPRYDLLNRILSLGLDEYWRKRLIEMLPQNDQLCLLDLATGTGDVALAVTRGRKGASIIGVDKSEEMLKLARRKCAKLTGSGSISLLRGDGLSIPVCSAAFDAVTIAFGIRNMPNTESCLREMTRLLREGGKALILEFSLPKNRVLRVLHLFYLRQVVPLVGRLISGDSTAYRYLNRTVETYLQGEDFCAIMRRAGFAEVSANPLSGGIVTIYEGYKR